MHLTIKFYERLTQWTLLPIGPGTNAPLQISQRYYSNYHNMFWTYFKISLYFEELVQIKLLVVNYKEGKAIKFRQF